MEKIKRILVPLDFSKRSREGRSPEPLWQSLKLREA